MGIITWVYPTLTTIMSVPLQVTVATMVWEEPVLVVLSDLPQVLIITMVYPTRTSMMLLPLKVPSFKVKLQFLHTTMEELSFLVCLNYAREHNVEFLVCSHSC